MKQGKTEKAVFAKLSSQKVELNAIADIKKQSENISQEYAELSRSARRFLGELDSIADKAFALEKRANVAVDINKI
jgi:hypothetical protein